MTAKMFLWALGVLLVSRDGKGAIIAGAVAMSHPLLDYITDARYLLPNGPVLGLSWYHSSFHDFAVEAVLLIAGWWIYRRSFSARGRRQPLLVLMLASLLLFQASIDLYLGSTQRGGWLGEEINSGKLFH